MPRLIWYPDGSDNPWRSWHDSQDSKVQARHSVVMRFLDAGHWYMEYFRSLEGYDDLGEIRITTDVAHRLVGRLDRNTKVFTVAIACTHKGQQYTPKEALDTAAKRIKEIEEGRVRALECNQPNPRPKPKPDPKRKRKPRRNRRRKGARP